MLLDVAPLNVLNVSDFYAILSHRLSIVPLASRAACLVPASHGLPSSSPLRAFLSTYPALSPHFEEMLRASCQSSTPFLLQLSLDSLPAAFASIHPCRRLSLGHICSSFLHRVHRLWCTVRLVYHPSHLAALLVLACLGLSSPCSPSLSLPPSFSLSRYSILYIHGISYLCLAFAVKPVIVQLQRHS